MREKIKIIKIEFNDFVMPKTFAWFLAFFKLCALKYIVNNNNYEKILLLDLDTITVQSYKELWMEADHGLLLYNVNHSYEHKDRKSIVQNYQHLYQNDKILVVNLLRQFNSNTGEQILIPIQVYWSFLVF